ncbi:unnamed protein product, partial [Symbiodinium necroappetens]
RVKLLETRSGSLETREPADIEFVIDPQMAVRDGLRLLETRSGSLETHDWVSNKCFVYAYHRGSSEPMWMNQAFRLRIDKAMDKWDKQTVQAFDPVESLYNQYNCFLGLIDGSLNDQTGDWAPMAIDSKVPLDTASNHLTEVHGVEIKHRDTRDAPADNADGKFGLCLTVWPSMEGRRAKPFTRREPRHWIKQELFAFPGFVCSQCNHAYFDGKIECQCCTIASVTDLSVIAEPDRVRRLATREGCPIRWDKGKGKACVPMGAWSSGNRPLAECLICFHDRFCTIDENAVLIKAATSNQYEFSLLQHDGDKYFVMQSEVLAIMGELATLFEKELPKSRNPNEREYPKLTLGRELALPPGVENLVRRQLNELLANTPYHQQRPEYFMDKVIEMSTAANKIAAHRLLRVLCQQGAVAAPTSVPALALLPTGTGHVPPHCK